MQAGNTNRGIKTPPAGIGILLFIGPSLVWCSEYIGSGEVILATRTGSILGTSVLWAIIIGIFLKFWIGMSGARYTVCTGEGMIDMFDRIPGPKHWAVWIVLVGQLIAATIAISSIASASGVFLSTLVPIPQHISGWIITLLAFLIAWTGEFKWLKIVMSLLILLVILGVFYVAVRVFPGVKSLLEGIIPQQPEVPSWALTKGIDTNPWREILPLIGWSAGGFASQVWYSYWVIGAGYGNAQKDLYGKPADVEKLKNISILSARKIKGWCRVVNTDASVAMIIGIATTAGFLIAGAGVLGRMQIVPEGEEVAIQLSEIFASHWGNTGAILFMVGGTAALFSTQIGQLAGWPRLLADTFRICIPAFGKALKWKNQFRLFLLFFFVSNMIIVYTIGYKPVMLVKLGAILDGLLLTPLQAIWIFIGLYVVMPKFLRNDTWKILKPHWIYGAVLIVAFLVFGYFCVYQIPRIW
jgi:Mn2+/Fe2+ NRAMP family transporter